MSRHKGRPVNVLISSPGGLLDNGLDIMRQFRDHGDVTVYISGFTASAATVAAMGAKKIVMGKYSFFLVHKCSNFIDAWGSYNADQIQKLIEDLTANKKENDKIDVVLAQLYADRCGKPISDILNVLKEGKWLNATEALALGFIDEISDDDKKQNLSLADKDRFLNMELPIDNLTFEDDTPSWFSRFIASFLGKKNEEHSIPDNGDNLNNNHLMKKKFNSIGKLLDKEDFTVADNGTVAISNDEMQKVEEHLAGLENSLASKDNDIATRDTRISELEEQVENLKKQPADDTKESVTTEDVNDDYIKRSKEMFNDVKDII
ncbi:MAG: ATP-dependent Clp protease proteolytic subunit [Bacteroidaceae bacterium]|nr:ATP-dependent Clp protease proteolytic subunit [Bacteroidaceae bacterium]